MVTDMEKQPLEGVPGILAVFHMYSFPDNNSRQIGRTSQKTERATFPAVYTNPFQLTNSPISGLRMPGPGICFSKEEEAEGVRCSLDGNWLIYSKLSLRHTSTLLAKFCHCFYSCIPRASVAWNWHALAFLCPVLGCTFMLLFCLERYLKATFSKTHLLVLV